MAKGKPTSKDATLTDFIEEFGDELADDFRPRSARSHVANQPVNYYTVEEDEPFDDTSTASQLRDPSPFDI